LPADYAPRLPTVANQICRAVTLKSGTALGVIQVFPAFAGPRPVSKLTSDRACDSHRSEEVDMEAGEGPETDGAAPPDRHLSRRELQVLDHIQQGLTNRQIAERLFVSPNTINKHVHQVLKKLEVRNRVQAATHGRG
jgi:DNA-binding NarL/FixJ family response regulator